MIDLYKPAPADATDATGHEINQLILTGHDNSMRSQQLAISN